MFSIIQPFFLDEMLKIAVDYDLYPYVIHTNLVILILVSNLWMTSILSKQRLFAILKKKSYNLYDVHFLTLNTPFQKHTMHSLTVDDINLN